MKKSKLVTIGGIMLVLGLCGYFFLGASGKEKIGWETVKVMRGSMSNMVSATGTVEPVTKWMSVRRYPVLSIGYMWTITVWLRRDN